MYSLLIWFDACNVFRVFSLKCWNKDYFIYSGMLSPGLCRLRAKGALFKRRHLCVTVTSKVAKLPLPRWNGCRIIPLFLFNPGMESKWNGGSSCGNGMAWDCYCECLPLGTGVKLASVDTGTRNSVLLRTWDNQQRSKFGHHRHHTSLITGLQKVALGARLLVLWPCSFKSWLSVAKFL